MYTTHNVFDIYLASYNASNYLAHNSQITKSNY